MPPLILYIYTVSSATRHCCLLLIIYINCKYTHRSSDVQVCCLCLSFCINCKDAWLLEWCASIICTNCIHTNAWVVCLCLLFVSTAWIFLGLKLVKGFVSSEKSSLHNATLTFAWWACGFWSWPTCRCFYLFQVTRHFISAALQKLSPVIALDIFQTSVTFIWWRMWFMKTGHTFTVSWQIYSRLY